MQNSFESIAVVLATLFFIGFFIVMFRSLKKNRFKHESGYQEINYEDTKKAAKKEEWYKVGLYICSASLIIETALERSGGPSSGILLFIGLWTFVFAGLIFVNKKIGEKRTVTDYVSYFWIVLGFFGMLGMIGFGVLTGSYL